MQTMKLHFCSFSRNFSQNGINSCVNCKMHLISILSLTFITMKASELYAIIATEETCVAFLQEHNLLPGDGNLPVCTKCRAATTQVTRRKKLRDGTIREYVSLRCTQRGCQTFQSIRKINAFFTYTDLNGRCHSNLSLGQILELCYYWVMDIPQVTVETLTGRCNQAVCDWFNLCRDVCVQLFEDRRPLGGPGERIEIDESLLRGKRKANRRRLLTGNLAAEEELDEEGPECELIDNNRNYGRRISGPWVFGLCWRHFVNGNEVLERRYFVVERRNRDTLLPIILEEVAPGSLIVSDEWPAYNTLNQHNYEHQTVNHQYFFVDPISGANTQTIETLWSQLKMKILRKMHGTTSEMLPRHLKESWWRSINPKKDLFFSLLRDIRTVFL